MGFLFIIPFVLIPMVFVFVFGVFAYTFFRMIKEKKVNDNSPRLTVNARIVDKRSDMGHLDHHHHYNYSYFVTFEFDSGDRTELRVPYNEFGLLVVGDVGELTLQGTRYIGFDRKREG